VTPVPWCGGNLGTGGTRISREKQGCLLGSQVPTCAHPPCTGNSRARASVARAGASDANDPLRGNWEPEGILDHKY
jgi:hypothetical protein